MPAARIVLTEKSASAIPFAESGQVIVRDAELPGFFVLVGTARKTYMVQADLRTNRRRRSVRVKVGEVGKLPAREARAKAKILLGSIADGIDPNAGQKPAEQVEEAPRYSGPTLQAAWGSYRESHMERKGRSAGTIASYRDHVERLLADWLDEPLGRFGEEPALAKDRHDRITKENGPYIANGCMRSFRAIYNHARKTSRSLPAENPVSAVDWNTEKRRNTALGPSDLTRISHLPKREAR